MKRCNEVSLEPSRPQAEHPQLSQHIFMGEIGIICVSGITGNISQYVYYCD